jgi:hypothetical protein
LEEIETGHFAACRSGRSGAGPYIMPPSNRHYFFLLTLNTFQNNIISTLTTTKGGNMTSNRKKGGSSSKPSPSALQKEVPAPSVFSLRLPAPLRTAADKYADATGVSLNGLLCIALADYLASRGCKVSPRP